MHLMRMYACTYAQGHVRLGLVLGRHPKIYLFGLHHCVICCEVETKSYRLGLQNIFPYANADNGRMV